MGSKELGRKLASARKKAGLTQAEAAQGTEWSQSKISRIESGEVSVSVGDAKALIKLYDVRETKARQITQLARESHQAAYRRKPK